MSGKSVSFFTAREQDDDALEQEVLKVSAVELMLFEWFTYGMQCWNF